MDIRTDGGTVGQADSLTNGQVVTKLYISWNCQYDHCLPGTLLGPTHLTVRTNKSN
jgi:hypothetical protein